MKIIFLDFDGVITTTSSIQTAFLTTDKPRKFPYKTQIDQELCANVRKLQEHMGAKIVISSTWRLLDELDELRQFLQERGGIDPESIIDQTPQRQDRSRGREIKDWLDLHPEVEEFLILDDDWDVTDVPSLQKHWIRTSMEEGFNQEKLAEAMATDVA